VSKAEVDAIKARFRDIAARPIAKVAEARARKKRRVTVALDKAKRKATTIMDTDEMGARAKMQAVAKAYRAADAKKAGYSVVVASKGGKTKGKKGGGATRVVDPRLKKDKRAAQRRDKKSRGSKR
jgi:AdoMet-dependent rRNA methyltransferase SPB1